MRPCGCDTDVLVFGHNYCVQQAWPYGKHLTCQCDRCPCTTCHKRDG
jgi:hypothetical protein